VKTDSSATSDSIVRGLVTLPRALWHGGIVYYRGKQCMIKVSKLCLQHVSSYIHTVE